MEISWITLIFISFGILAPRNGAVTAALTFAAIAVAGAIFLITEMELPFSGIIHIPRSLLQAAVDQIGR